MPQGGLQWQGTQRRAYGPGANWNVQVVRGKSSTRCLWHACKALGIGLLLMLLGACMATIGYYADQLSTGQENKGNLTVWVKNESRGFHLNNLSYAGPIVMGFGGFIVVAACVMTFEARDNAAKVVPARYRFSQASTMKHHTNKSQKNRKSTSSQTSKWDHQLGLFLVNRSPSPSTREISRKQLTAEFLQFSKSLKDKDNTSQAGLKRSPSAPTLAEKRSPRKKTTRHGGCALLNADLLKRHALSVDNPSYNPQQKSSDYLNYQKSSGSQASMVMDLHLPNKGPITLKVKDRSDTARRHQLARQTKIEDAEDLEEAKKMAAEIRGYSPKLPGKYRFPDDFVPRKRDSIDLRLLEDLASRDFARTSLRDFRKTSSPNFRKMSLDKIGGERKLDKSNPNFRKASLEFKRSPDFKRSDYRNYSIERFTADCAKYFADEAEKRSRKTISNSELSQRKHRHPKLYHSRSDDSRTKSSERQSRDSQSSRYSLNTQVVMEDRSSYGDYEMKYFAKSSLDTEESLRHDNSDDSHMLDYDDIFPSSDVDAGALLEEPELENLPDNDDDNGNADNETFNYRARKVFKDDLAHYAKQETLSPDEDNSSGCIHETQVCIEREDRDDIGDVVVQVEDSKEVVKDCSNNDDTVIIDVPSELDK